MAKSKKAKSLQRELTSRLQKIMGSIATRELMETHAPNLLASLKKGMPVPVVADLLAHKIAKLAIDPKKPNQWAVELIYDRLEGKTAQGEQVKETGRILEEQLDAVTAQHLNALALESARSEHRKQAKTSDVTPGQVPGDVEMSDNGTFDTEEERRQLDMASEVT